MDAFLVFRKKKTDFRADGLSGLDALGRKKAAREHRSIKFRGHGQSSRGGGGVDVIRRNEEIMRYYANRITCPP